MQEPSQWRRVILGGLAGHVFSRRSACMPRRNPTTTWATGCRKSRPGQLPAIRK